MIHNKWLMLNTIYNHGGATKNFIHAPAPAKGTLIIKLHLTAG